MIKKKKEVYKWGVPIHQVSRSTESPPRPRSSYSHDSRYLKANNFCKSSYLFVASDFKFNNK